MAAGTDCCCLVGRRRGIGGIYPNKNLISKIIQWIEVDEERRRRWWCLNRRRVRREGRRQERGGGDESDGVSKGERDAWVMADDVLCGRPDKTSGRAWQQERTTGMAGRDSRGHVLRLW